MIGRTGLRPVGTGGDTAGAVALRLRKVDVHYSGRGRRSGPVVALRGVDLEIPGGQRVAIVGRSGAGKTTIARAALGLVEPTAGSVETLGHDLGSLSRRGLRGLRRRVQLVHQDPYQSLHPGLRVRTLVAEPLAIAGLGRSDQNRPVIEALEELGLRPAAQFLDRYPASLSGGQRQRVAIARTVVARPELILADEPTSMLDASLRATVAEHLLALHDALDATLVFITHDLALACNVAERIVVMADGEIVEDGPTDELLAAPTQAETRRLLRAARSLDARSASMDTILSTNGEPER